MAKVPPECHWGINPPTNTSDPAHQRVIPPLLLCSSHKTNGENLIVHENKLTSTVFCNFSSSRSNFLFHNFQLLQEQLPKSGSRKIMRVSRAETSPRKSAGEAHPRPNVLNKHGFAVICKEVIRNGHSKATSLDSGKIPEHETTWQTASSRSYHGCNQCCSSFLLEHHDLLVVLNFINLDLVSQSWLLP